jgi:hypothetical protein
MITYGEGKYKVNLIKKKIGDDLLYILEGGEKTHIGGIVICAPNLPPQCIRLKDHYDDIVLKPIAETACKKYKTKIVVIGGIHVDNASKGEIDKLIHNCKELGKCI